MRKSTQMWRLIVGLGVVGLALLSWTISRRQSTPAAPDSAEEARQSAVALDTLLKPQNAALPTPTPKTLPVAKPGLVTRQQWKAKPARDGMKPHRPQFITIHHTATRQNTRIPVEQKMRNLQDFSQRSNRLDSGKNKPAWPDVPYHYYIAANGCIAEGRDVKFSGDTNTEYNPSGHILVVVEGNFENEQPTPAQLQALNRLVPWLSQHWKIAASKIKGHNDYASTDCPGDNLTKILDPLRRYVIKITGQSLPARPANKPTALPRATGEYRERAQVESQVREVRKHYSYINAHLKQYKKIEKGISGGEGGLLTAYFDNGRVTKVIAEETSLRVYEYYYWRGHLIFIFHQSIHPNEPEELTELYPNDENRFYFHNGQMIRWIAANEKLVSKLDAEYESKQERLIDDAKRFLKAIKSKEEYFDITE